MEEESSPRTYGSLLVFDLIYDNNQLISFRFFVIFSNLFIQYLSQQLPFLTPLLLPVLHHHSLTSHLALSSFLPSLFLAFMHPCSAPSSSLQSLLCSASSPPHSIQFPWSVRHNWPLVSRLASSWLPATCFSSFFSCCLGFCSLSL